MISVEHRRRAVAVFQNLAVSAEETEKRCFEACRRGTLKSYLAVICHEKHKITAPPSQCRKRPIDDSFGLPNPKKARCIPHYRWRVECNEPFGSEMLKSITRISATENSMLEEQFLAGKDKATLSLLDDEKIINFGKMEVDEMKRLKRSIFVLGQKLKIPGYWTKRQTNTFLSVNLDEDNELYRFIVGQFLESMRETGRVVINFVKQLQHVVQYQRYCNHRAAMALSHTDKEDVKQTLAYYASGSVAPRAILSDMDGFDASELELETPGIPFYTNAREADKNAYRIRNPADIPAEGIRKQLIVALVSTGVHIVQSLLEAMQNTRPPAERCEGDSYVLYDSVKVKLSEGNSVFYIHHQSQAYPAFVIDYTIVENQQSVDFKMFENTKHNKQ